MPRIVHHVPGQDVHALCVLDGRQSFRVGVHEVLRERAQGVDGGAARRRGGRPGLREAQTAPQRHARAPMPVVIRADARGKSRGRGKARGERGQPRVELAFQPADLREHLARGRVVARVRARGDGDQGGGEHRLEGGAACDHQWNPTTALAACSPWSASTRV